MDFDKLWNFSDPAASETQLRALLPEAERIGGAYHLELLTQLARTQSLQHKFAEGHAILDQVEPVKETTPRVHIRYLLERGRTFNSSGQRDQARPLFLTAWEIGRSSGEDNLTVDAAHMLGIVESGDESLRWNELALAHAEQSSDIKARNWLGSLYNNIGWTYHDMGRFDEAFDKFQCALAFRQTQGNVDNIRIAKWSVARCLRSLKHWPEALVMQRELLAEFDAAGATDGYVFEELGECLLVLDRPAEAQPFFARAYAELSKDAYLVEHEAARLARLKQLAASS